MSSDQPTSAISNCPFSVVRIFARHFASSSGLNLNLGDLRPAWFSLTTNIRWIPVDNAKRSPLTLVDFRYAPCFLLARLPEGSMWEDVSKQVRIEKIAGVISLVVQGKLKSKLPSRQVQLFIIAADGQKSDLSNLLNIVLIRIAPWPLIFSAIIRINDVSNKNSKSASLHEQLFKLSADTKLNALVHDISQEHKNARPENAAGPSRGENFIDTARVPSDAIKSLLDYIGTSTSIMKQFVTIADSSAATEPGNNGFSDVADVLQHVSDATKGVSILSATFQLMAIGVQVAILARESHRGIKQYPLLLAFIVRLYRELSSNIPILIQRPSRTIRDMQTENLLRSFQQTFDLLVKTEHELMRGKGMRLLKGNELKKIEGKVDELEQKVLQISTFAEVQKLRAEFQKMKHFSNTPVSQLSACPPLTKFFSGRTAELEDVLEKLKSYGKAFITQYGGAGKTQLMALVVDKIQKNNLAVGDVFWITVDGGRESVLSSIASFVEALRKENMKPDDRTNRSKVLYALRNELGKVDGRWLLCLDNADNPDGNEIIGDICELVSVDHGWVILTSQQGFRSFIAIIEEQETVQIKPLLEEMAMVVLWRWKTNQRWDQKSDENVLNDLKSNENGCRAIRALMRKLALNGLPLALQNVGSYMQGTGISFARYMNICQDMESRADLKRILQSHIERGVVREEQKAIWTTWAISVERLSSSARQVLYVLALFGGGAIARSLTERVVKFVAHGNEIWKADYLNWVIIELVNNTSLVEVVEKVETEWVNIHPLIRQFITRDVTRMESILRHTIEIGTEAVHGSATVLMEMYEASVTEPPEVFGEDVRQLVEHTFGILEHSWKLSPGIERERRRTSISWNQLIERWKRSKRETETFSSQGKLDDLHFFVSHTFQCQCRYTEALKIGWKLVARYSRRNGTKRDLLKKSYALHDIGKTYLMEKKQGEAEDVLRKCLEVRRRLCGTRVGHLDVAIALLNLGEVNEQLNLLDEAEEMYRESLGMLLRLFGEEVAHKKIACATRGLARVLYRRNLLPEAEEMFRKCLEMQFRLCGEMKDDIDVSHTMNDLALVMLDQGRLQDAEAMLQDSIGMYQRIGGEMADHVNVATTLVNLGGVQRRQGNLDVAEKTIRESVSMYERLLGENSNHPYLEWARDDLEQIVSERR